MSNQEAVNTILEQNEIDLNPPASVYADRIANGTSFTEPLDTKNLLRYLAASIDVVDKDTKKAKRQLEAIIRGDSPESVGSDDSKAGQITEREYADIMHGFESFTEQKVRRDELLTMEDFEKYAERTGYSVEKVLYATDWLDSYLSDEVIARIEESEESLTL